MILALRNFQQTVQDAAAAAQGAASTALDFTVGAPLLALTQAGASVALWLQYVALQVLSATRLSTSTGADVDSFVADYGLARLPAVAATGTVTLARYSSAAQAVVLPGAQVKTTDGTQAFSVAADPTNPLWNASLGYFVVPAGVPSVSVTVVANAAGPGGNVLAGAITLLATAIAGIDTVGNAVAFTNGAAAEGDAALRARFTLYLASLSRATLAAVGAAIAGVQQGLSYVVIENAPGLGRFAVTVDDGSGAPPAALLASVYAAVDAVRPVGSVFSVAGPSVVAASVSILLTIPANVARPPVVAAVNAAITAYVASLGVGQTLLYGRLFQVAYDASASVTGATITLNGGTADLPAGQTGVIQAASISVA